MVALGDDFEQVSVRRRKVEDADMDITPMIDMTFLLLIFFILTGTLADDSGVSLPPAKHGVVVQVDHAIVLSITAGEPGMPAVFKGRQADAKQRLIGGTAEELDAAIEAYVEEEAGKSDKKKFVLVQASREVKSREVSRVVRAAAREAIEQVFVGVMEN